MSVSHATVGRNLDPRIAIRISFPPLLQSGSRQGRQCYTQRSVLEPHLSALPFFHLPFCHSASRAPPSLGPPLTSLQLFSSHLCWFLISSPRHLFSGPCMSLSPLPGRCCGTVFSPWPSPPPRRKPSAPLEPPIPLDCFISSTAHIAT